MSRYLIVSLHDVSPLTADVCERILADLESAGVSRVSLLVVPNHHKRAEIIHYKKFTEWLHDKADLGHEMVLHGYYHMRLSRENESWVSRIINSFYTEGEGEFYDITYNEARKLVAQGRDALLACGLESEGFIAPAWLLSDGAKRALYDENFLYTTRLKCIEPVNGDILPTQSLVWSVRASWRREVSLLWNAWLARRLASNPVMRLGIHPPDWNYPQIREQILKLVKKALAAPRIPSTYRDCVKTLWKDTP